MFRPSRFRDLVARVSGASVLVALLILTFAVAALLVLEAWGTSAAQRATGRRALQDVATYAAWNAARLEESSLHLALSTVFQRVSGRAAPGEELLPPLEAVQHGAAHAESCRCAPTIPVRYYFRLDLRTGSVTTTAPRGPADSTAWLADSVRAAIGRYMFPYVITFGSHGAHGMAAAYTLRRSSTGEVIGAYGLVTRADSLAESALPRVLDARKGIIPLALRGESPNEAIVALTVHGPSGVALRGGGAAIDYTAEGMVSDTTTLAPWAGGMFVRLCLRPEAARLLRREVATPLRLPIWIALLGLTGGLVVVIVRQLRREQELARVRAEFTTSVSHELRTPLAQILLFGDTLALGRARSRHERTSAAEVIVREARRLIRMVENALHFSRSDRQQVEIVRERVELAPLVREVLANFAPLAWAAGVRIDDDLQDDAMAMVDRAAVRQILLNLLDNAIKYGPRGQRVLVTLNVRRDDRGHSALLAVEDEGPGVPAEARHRIWLPFVRVPTQGREATGSGIGLAVVHDLALRHGGTAWVEDRGDPSGSNTGARFIVAFPAESGATIEAGDTSGGTG